MAREVKVIVGAETSKYERAMRDVRMSTRKTTGFISSAWLKAAGAFYGLLKAYDVAKLGVQAEQEAASFASMAASYGASADHIIMKLKEASAGTVDTMTLVQKAGTAMMMGISPDKISKLMEIARATARMTGQSVTKSFEDISLAVGRQSRMILDNLGIIVQAGAANQRYAEILGKTAEELTETEKKQAFLNATVEAGEELIKRLGDQTKTTAEMFQSFEAMAKNLKVWVGQALVWVGKWITIGFFKTVSAINWALGELSAGFSFFFGILKRVPGAGEHLKDWEKALSVLSAKFELSRIEAEKFVKEMVNLQETPLPTITPAGISGGGGGPEDGKDLASRQMQDLDLMFSFYEQDRALLQKNLEEKMALRQAAAEQEAELQMQSLDQMFAFYDQDTEYLRRKYEEERAEREKKAAEEVRREEQIQRMKTAAQQNYYKTATTLITGFATMAGVKSKGVFAIAKGLEIGKATMAAFSAFNLALANPPGPPWTIPMAKAALAMGMSNVAAIAATSLMQLATMSGGAASGGGGSIGGGGIAVPAPEPISTPAEPENQAPQVTIYIEGDSINDEEYLERWAEKISEMVEGSEIRLVASHSKFAEDLA